ncbi:MAG: response regulator transcription factor [Actinobacteria bacterium]|nr:MAG: response regulator transcription factor [Actinomycetota bacterium]
MGGTGLGVEGRAGSDLPGPVRVAIVDDHPVVREAFGNLFDLVEGLEVVATAGDANEAMAKLATTPVDVAIVDFALPGVDGSVLTDRIKDSHPDVRVLIFTASSAGRRVGGRRDPPQEHPDRLPGGGHPGRGQRAPGGGPGPVRGPDGGR